MLRTMGSSFPGMYKGLSRGQFLVAQCINNVQLTDNLSSTSTLSAGDETQTIEAIEYTSAEIVEAACSMEAYILSEADEILIDCDTNLQLNEVECAIVENSIPLENNIIELIPCSKVTEEPISEDQNRISSNDITQNYNNKTNAESVSCETNSSNDPDWVATNSNKCNADQESSTFSEEASGTSINQNSKRTTKQHKQGLKRQRNVDLRIKGKEYDGLVRTEAGRYSIHVRSARKMGNRCGHSTTKAKPSKVKSKIKSDSSRTFLCAQISENLRKTKFEEFWALNSWDAKRAYVLGLVDKHKPYKRRGNQESSRKTASFDCYLHNANGIKVRVCRSFFLNTLSLGRDTFARWITSGLTIDDDNATDKKPESVLIKKNKEKSSSVREWLALLPKVPSHYCRSNSSRVYLESTFSSKSHLHSVYEAWCKENNIINVASRITFVNILKQQKISIHKPRKDQCDTCYQFKVGNLDQVEYNEHRVKKQEARDAKQKEKSEASDKKLVITMDLQSVLLSPKLLVSAIYYSQKLQVHDFTIYSLNNGEVYLYVWHEGEGGVTSNEFVSCIADFISNIADTYEEVVLISDGCNYQNRNKVLASELSNLAVKKKIIIEQLILEKGHTMMEADSVHSTLEALFKPPICSPGDYVSRMRAALPKKPYNVKQIDHTFFMNYESQSNNYSSIRPGRKTGDPVVVDIRALQYLPSGVVKFKLRQTDDWSILPQRRPNSKSIVPLPPLSNSPRKIKAEKFDQLQELKSALPVEYHPFYDSLLCE